MLISLLNSRIETGVIMQMLNDSRVNGIWRKDELFNENGLYLGKGLEDKRNFLIILKNFHVYLMIDGFGMIFRWAIVGGILSRQLLKTFLLLTHRVWR